MNVPVDIEQLRSDFSDAIATVEELDQVNEHLRRRLLDTIGWWEDDVTASIARERALRVQNSQLEQQINELTNSLPIRVTRPLVRARESIRSRFGRGGR